MQETARPAIGPDARKAADMIHVRLKEAALGMQEAQQFWKGRDDGYYEGFEAGLDAAKLHVEDALQAFMSAELLMELVNTGLEGY